MKKSILLLGLIALVALPASAELTTTDISSPEYLINHGHSTVAAEAVARVKAAANGVEYTAVKPTAWQRAWDRGFLKAIKSIYTYIDPAADQDTFLNHDIRMTPHPHDL